MGWQHDIAKQKAHRQRVDDDPPLCLFCNKQIPKPRRYTAAVLYCNDVHKEKMKAKRKKNNRARERAEAQLADADAEGYREDQIRRGQVFERVAADLTDDEWTSWLDRDISDAQVAKRIGSTPQAVGYARRAGVNDRLRDLSKGEFVLSHQFAEMLGPDHEVMVELLAEDPDGFEKRLGELVQAFVSWRTHFFSAGVTEPYLTKDVHERWIFATLKTIYTGGRTMILSPPRHGKTDLLIHFCVWLICRNPHIRILWVGPNSDIGELALGQVRDLLETHEELAEAYLPAGESWAPDKRGGTQPWQAAKFTVANRTLRLKTPTMWATGVKGKILSLDADFIIVDDPADPDDSWTPGGREKIWNWFKVKLISRKMDKTGLVMISSRVHPDDLYAQYIDKKNWDTQVDRAHDNTICGLDLFDKHTDEDCVLFPEINSLRYLREQYDDVGAATFDMMYLNKPRPDGTLIFDPELIEAECLDRSRGIGIEGLPPGVRLVAGLDPAARSTQAAFLWAVQLPTPEEIAQAARDPRVVAPAEHYWMVDMETQQAGGIEGAVKVMTDWEEKYGADLWVVESTAYQKVFFDDPRVKTLEAQGYVIKPHDTQGRNKHDPDFGVASTAPIYHEGKVTLPYATREAQRKTDALVKQLTNFTGDTGQSRHKSDILMASWFPHVKVIRKWKRRGSKPKTRQTSQRSYPNWQPMDSSELPYPKTSYPGG